MKGCGRKGLWLDLRYCSGICLEGLRKLWSSLSWWLVSSPRSDLGTFWIWAESVTTRVNFSVLSSTKKGADPSRCLRVLYPYVSSNNNELLTIEFWSFLFYLNVNTTLSVLLTKFKINSIFYINLYMNYATYNPSMILVTGLFLYYKTKLKTQPDLKLHWNQ